MEESQKSKKIKTVLSKLLQSWKPLECLKGKLQKKLKKLPKTEKKSCKLQILQILPQILVATFSIINQ